jgi:hypothetical protein
MLEALMIRDQLFVLRLESKEIQAVDFLAVSTSALSIQKLVDFHAKQVENKKICNNLDYNFELYKINHNNNSNRLNVLNIAHKYNSEAYIDVIISEGTPIFSYERNTFSSMQHENKSIEFISSDTLYFLNTIDKNIKSKLNKRQLEHLNFFGWIDIYNV